MQNQSLKHHLQDRDQLQAQPKRRDLQLESHLLNHLLILIVLADIQIGLILSSDRPFTGTSLGKFWSKKSRMLEQKTLKKSQRDAAATLLHVITRVVKVQAIMNTTLLVKNLLLKKTE